MKRKRRCFKVWFQFLDLKCVQLYLFMLLLLIYLFFTILLLTVYLILTICQKGQFCYDRTIFENLQKNLNIEKIIFKVVQMKFSAMQITNKKIIYTW